MLSARLTGLPKDSVANVSQVVALDKALLTDSIGRLRGAQLGLVLSGIAVVLGR
jgi:mRNA-degrading endonuclease toxin of MazEF toxin-antitoxin module